MHKTDEIKEIAAFLMGLTGGDTRDLKAFLKNGVEAEKAAREKREQSEREEKEVQEFWERAPKINGRGLLVYLEATGWKTEKEDGSEDFCLFNRKSSRYVYEWSERCIPLDIDKYKGNEGDFDGFDFWLIRDSISFRQTFIDVAAYEGITVPDLLTKIENFLKRTE